MKKTAVLLYEQFCNFEISVVLEILAMAGKSINVFAKTLQPVKSEEGLIILPEQSIEELEVGKYDSLILPGALDIRETIEDEAIIEFIKKFNRDDFIIGAISIAPLLLLKAGLLKGKKFMAGVNKEELYREGFTKKELEQMVGWEQNIKKPVRAGYIKDGNIITSVSYNFISWALAFGKALEIKVYPESFGVSEKMKNI